MSAWCGNCSTSVVPAADGSCSWCGQATRRKRGGGKPVDKHLKHTSPEVLRLAYELHRRGASIREVARRLQAGGVTTYASDKAAAVALSDAFKARGWPARTRIQATVLASTVHGKSRRGLRDPEHRRELRVARGEIRGVRCAALTVAGQPCSRAALCGGEFCVAHDPSRRGEVLKRLAAARARARGVSA